MKRSQAPSKLRQPPTGSGFRVPVCQNRAPLKDKGSSSLSASVKPDLGTGSSTTKYFTVELFKQVFNIENSHILPSHSRPSIARPALGSTKSGKTMPCSVSGPKIGLPFSSEVPAVSKLHDIKVKYDGRSVNDGSGKEIARGSGFPVAQLQDLRAGSSLSCGGKEVELLEEISFERFKRLTSGMNAAGTEAKDDSKETKVVKKVVNDAVFKKFAVPRRADGSKTIASSPSVVANPDPKANLVSHPDALVLPRPPFDPNRFPTEGICNVAVDPYLGKHLRQHQKDGVIFLYSCVMGFNDSGNSGAILADEMGLGKSLQTITL